MNSKGKVFVGLSPKESRLRLPTGQAGGSQKRAFVGLSGGVDSSVSAALLKKQGYNVTGVFIKVWQADFLPCNWKEERRDAMRVCAHLKIPFKTLDLSKEYKKDVVDYMVSEYKAGRTPNPDVMCNKYVKFGGFFDWAMEQGADYVATGHYAKILNLKSKISNLAQAKDKNKDQSYFLWNLTKKQLTHTLFPVGHLEKPEVRKLAKKFGLNTAEKKDSQGLCFIGKVDLKEFLEHFIKAKKGKVLDEQGNVIGSHDGAIFYTLGQRHGFLISDKSSANSPQYVVKKDIKKNILVVSHKEPENESLANVSKIEIQKTNWISEIPKASKKYTGRIRYRGKLEACTIETSKNSATVVFKKPQWGVAPGQSFVAYNGEECIGGGIIRAAFSL